MRPTWQTFVAAAFLVGIIVSCADMNLIDLLRLLLCLCVWIGLQVSAAMIVGWFAWLVRRKK